MPKAKFANSACLYANVGTVLICQKDEFYELNVLIESTQ